MHRPPHSITLRALAIGALLIVANSYWLGHVEMIWHTAHLTTVALPVNVVFITLVLTWWNVLLRRFAPRRALHHGELLTVHAMLATGSAFVGHDFMPRLMGLIPHAFRYASTENDWQALLFGFLPRWLVVGDVNAVRAFYRGGARFFGDGYWKAWAAPLAAWATVVLLLMVLFLCLAVLLREQWVTRERLAYPLIQVPYHMTTDAAAVFRRRVFWVGFALAATLNLWNGLQFFYPILPEIPVKKHNLLTYLTERPWNAIGGTPLRFHPLLIGLAYLLPLDLSFSIVFFYVLRKLQHVVGSATAISVTGYPFLGEQGAGALLALLVMAFWIGRRHVVRVVIRVRRPAHEGARHEAVPYRVAVGGLILAALALGVVCLRAGMTPWGYGVFIATYLSIVVGLTRMRTELGPPIHAIGYATPQHLLISAAGTRVLGPRNLTMLSMLNWLSGASYASFRTHPMPHQMEAFKLADWAGIRNRSMLLALLTAGVVGVVASLVLYPYLIYREGVPSGAAEQIHAGGNETYTFLASWLLSPRPPNWMATSVLAATFLLNLGIYALRTRFLWCPLHPAGYVIGVAPGTTDILWFPLFLAMCIKWMLLRQGGFRAYRRAIPFFTGCVLGEALVGSFWPLVSLLTRTTVYSWI